MTTRLAPLLMFEGCAEAAMSFYVGLFPGARLVDVARYGEGDPGPAGSIRKATFVLADQTIHCIDSPIAHGFTFTPSISLAIDCESEAEIRRLAAALSEGGSVLMPLDAYWFSPRFAWVNDRYGVSWQLNLLEPADRG